MLKSTEPARQLSVLFFAQFPLEHPKNNVYQTQDNGAQKGRQETLNPEARHEESREFQHQCVNDKPEDAESQNRQRKGEDLQDRADCRIHQSDDNRCEQCGSEAAELKTGDDVSDDQQSESAENPVEQQVQHEAPENRRSPAG